MKRDGANISLWQHAMENYKSDRHALPSEGVDVVIVGGGITGVTTALLLQKAGKSCVLLEAHSLGFGTTSGTTAHLNTMLDTTYADIEKNFGVDGSKMVSKATREAMDLFKKHVQEYQIDCGFQELPGYTFSQNVEQSKELESIFEASIKAGIDVKYIDSIPVPIQFEKAIRFEGQGQLHPTKYLFALASEFEKAGGIIIQNCRVTDVTGGDSVEIDTSYGKLTAKDAVYATHIPPGINVLHMKCAPYRSYSLAVKLKNNQYPQADVYDMYDPYRYYRTQEVNGEKYLIAGGEDHKTAHEENTEICFQRLEAYVRAHFEVESVPFKWSSQYFEPTDGLSYIGELPSFESHVYVATGFSGNGITMSHVAALEITDMILEGKSRYNNLFQPSRIKMGGLGNFIKEQADVAVEYVSKKFFRPKLEQLADLAPGEGKVVKYEGETIALHKDEKGNLHAINPTCTHMTCSVAWNTTEKSWDCPCHGARFSCYGQVLTGPASKDLAMIELNKEEEISAQ